MYIRYSSYNVSISLVKGTNSSPLQLKKQVHQKFQIHDIHHVNIAVQGKYAEGSNAMYSSCPL